MCLLPYDLFLHKFLCRFRVLRQIVDLLVGEVLLREPDLLLHPIFYSIFELGLYRLGSPQDVSELLRDRFVHELLDPLLGLVLHRAVFTDIYVLFHVVQEVFDGLLSLAIVLDQSVHVLRFDYNT